MKACLLVLLLAATAVAASVAPRRSLLDTCRGVRDQCLDSIDNVSFCQAGHRNRCQNGMKCRNVKGEPWCIDGCHDSKDTCSSDTTFCAHGKTHKCNSQSTCTRDLNGKPMCVANKPQTDDKCKKYGQDWQCTSDQKGLCKNGKYKACESGQACYLSADVNDQSVPTCIWT